MALIAQVATLESRVPFLHFFDGFRTSHELNTLDLIPDADIRAMIDDDLVRAHRAPRAFARKPIHPRHRAEPRYVLPGARGREPLLRQRPGHRRTRHAALRRAHRPPLPPVRLRRRPGRRARPDPDGLRRRNRAPDRVRAPGRRRESRRPPGPPVPPVLRRPPARRAARHRPPHRRAGTGQGARRRRRAACSRTSSPHSPAPSPAASAPPCRFVIGGRYGLSSKDFTPAMAKAAFDELKRRLAAQRLHRRHRRRRHPHQPRRRPGLHASSPPASPRAVFYGLGADGTVGANKNSVKIIAEDAGLYAQGYFVYDSHKSGAQTISHLRFGPDPIRSPYLIAQAGFVGLPPVRLPRPPGPAARSPPPAPPSCSTSPCPADEVWDAAVPRRCSSTIIDRKLRLFAIDASASRARSRPRRAHQHRPADLLLRHLRRAAARRGDRPHQGSHPQDLRPQGPDRRRQELRRRRRRRWPACTKSRSPPR